MKSKYWEEDTPPGQIPGNRLLLQNKYRGGVILRGEMQEKGILFRPKARRWPPLQIKYQGGVII